MSFAKIKKVFALVVLMTASSFVVTCSGDVGGKPNYPKPPSATWQLPTPAPVAIGERTPVFSFDREESEEPQLESFFLYRFGELTFVPAKVIAIVIYEGTEKKYSKVVVEENAVAFLAPETGCEEYQGRCVISPVPATRCRGCENLVEGKAYVAFFFTRVTQPYEDVIAVDVKFH